MAGWPYLEDGERDGRQRSLVGQFPDREDVHAPVGRVLKDLQKFNRNDWAATWISFRVSYCQRNYDSMA